MKARIIISILWLVVYSCFAHPAADQLDMISGSNQKPSNIHKRIPGEKLEQLLKRIEKWELAMKIKNSPAMQAALAQWKELKHDYKAIPADVEYEMRLGPVEMIKHRGYPAESHKVVTREGYIITLHRIPYGRSGQDGSRRPPVFLQHGLGSQTSSWISNLAHQSLAFVLADAGYDVWIGNMRGNRFSRGHTTLNSATDIKYWHYSIDQVGKLDLPDVLDYVLKKTGNTKLFYVGHSLGTMVMFAGLSSSQELNDKIRLFVALTPVTSVVNVSGIAALIAPFADLIGAVAAELGIGVYGGDEPDFDQIKEMCQEQEELNMCEWGWAISGGYDGAYVNRTRIPIWSASDSSGVSVRTLLHLGQIINRGEHNFKLYDYGILENMEHYGQPNAPDYELSKIRAPMAFFYTDKDVLASKDDLQWMLKQIGADNIPRVVDVPEKNPALIDGNIEHGHTKATPLVFIKNIPQYTHFDFTMAYNAKDWVYDDILKLFKQY